MESLHCDGAAINEPGTQMPRLADVGDHPGGASPYGVLDMVGNVYQWTDRFVDARTAKSVLRGASAYVPEPMRPDEPADPTGLKHTKGNWCASSSSLHIEWTAKCCEF
eukprot:SAG31_NODE_2255_length_6073_cov_2.134248_1_plen_108_part_00